MGNFLLNRPDDRDTQSKGRIIVNMLIWLVILYAGYLVLYVICMGIYGANGVIPTKLTEYGTDPYYWKEQPFWQTILWVLILAPLCEESMFRLGLSFKRRTVGLWAGLLPVVEHGMCSIAESGSSFFFLHLLEVSFSGSSADTLPMNNGRTGGRIILYRPCGFLRSDSAFFTSMRLAS